MDLARSLERDVQTLASIGPKNLRDEARAERLAKAAGWVCERFDELGYVPAIDRLRVERRGVPSRVVDVLVVEHHGDAAGHRTLVVGAHYDTQRRLGGSDDATGLALLLSLADRLRGRALSRSVRLCAFPSDEARSVEPASRAYARRCRERGDCIDGMIALEDLGHRAPLFDFFAVVGNLRSRTFARRVHEGLGPHPRVAARRIVLPGFLPLVRSSDHSSFWQEGWPAVMLTDGARLRQRPSAVDFARLSEVSRAVGDAVIRLASAPR